MELASSIAALHDPGSRAKAAAELARRVGGDALLIFVWDERAEVFVPARGMRGSIPGGPEWKAFLQPNPEERIFRFELPDAPEGPLLPVVALANALCIFAFFGGLGEERLEPLRPFLPLLGTLFRLENMERDAQARARLADDSAAQANQLSQALNTTRCALEQALRESREVGRSYASQAAALRASEAQLRDLMKKLEASNRELEQFAYVAAHDLQEPLRTLSNFCGLLRKRNAEQLDDGGKEYLRFILNAAGRALDLIEDLLRFSRIGNDELAARPVDCSAAVAAALAALDAAIIESGVDIRCASLPIVDADERQLTQVFQNLLGNAIKFRRKERPRIEISAEEQPDAWKIVVADNGIGIRPEYHARIFAVFQRLHSRELYPGTGIGLAICKKIIERHGGEIGVASTGEAGSRFFFTIPKQRPPQPAPHTELNVPP